MNFQNASARAIGDLHWCISFLCQATPLLMWNFRIISFTETIIESKKWWHTKTTMSAKCWWSPRRASTCCSSTSPPGITRWSGEMIRWASFLHNRKRELFRYEVNNVKSTCCSICVWRSGPRKREILIDPMKDYIYVIVYVSSFAAFL